MLQATQWPCHHMDQMVFEEEKSCTYICHGPFKGGSKQMFLSILGCEKVAL